MGTISVTCTECGHENEVFISNDVWHRAEERGELEEEAELMICGDERDSNDGCGQTLRYKFVPSQGEVDVTSQPTHEAFRSESSN